MVVVDHGDELPLTWTVNVTLRSEVKRKLQTRVTRLGPVVFMRFKFMDDPLLKKHYVVHIVGTGLAVQW